MKNIFRYIVSLIILAVVLNCSRISEKIEKKVDEKIDQKIDETMKKMDSSFEKIRIDSLMKITDSLKTGNEKDKHSKKVK